MATMGLGQVSRKKYEEIVTSKLSRRLQEARSKQDELEKEITLSVLEESGVFQLAAEYKKLADRLNAIVEEVEALVGFPNSYLYRISREFDPKEWRVTNGKAKIAIETKQKESKELKALKEKGQQLLEAQSQLVEQIWVADAPEAIVAILAKVNGL